MIEIIEEEDSFSLELEPEKKKKRKLNKNEKRKNISKKNIKKSSRIIKEDLLQNDNDHDEDIFEVLVFSFVE